MWFKFPFWISIFHYSHYTLFFGKRKNFHLFFHDQLAPLKYVCVTFGYFIQGIKSFWSLSEVSSYLASPILGLAGILHDFMRGLKFTLWYQGWGTSGFNLNSGWFFWGVKKNIVFSSAIVAKYLHFRFFFLSVCPSLCGMWVIFN